ncbi:hypothetical protein HZB01_05020 [Candidatus Woesearchaeota archaeon]|nr:hypothetical protein [Candidatus Woesearchaeota archaeon]
MNKKTMQEVFLSVFKRKDVGVLFLLEAWFFVCVWLLLQLWQKLVDVKMASLPDTDLDATASSVADLRLAADPYLQGFLYAQTIALLLILALIVLYCVLNTVLWARILRQKVALHSIWKALLFVGLGWVLWLVAAVVLFLFTATPLWLLGWLALATPCWLLVSTFLFMSFCLKEPVRKRMQTLLVQIKHVGWYILATALMLVILILIALIPFPSFWGEDAVIVAMLVFWLLWLKCIYGELFLRIQSYGSTKR